MNESMEDLRMNRKIVILINGTGGSMATLDDLLSFCLQLINPWFSHINHVSNLSSSLLKKMLISFLEEEKPKMNLHASIRVNFRLDSIPQETFRKGNATCGYLEKG